MKRCVLSEWGRSMVKETTDEVALRGLAAGPGTPAPWGSPPTPLLPRWFREVLASVQIPDELRDSDFPVMTVGDLEQWWRSQSAPLDVATHRALIVLVGDYRPSTDHVVVPPAFDRAILKQYPLRVRTSNCLKRSGLLTGEGAITVGRLQSIPNFGITAMLELMCIMEASPGQVPLATPANGSDAHNPQEASWSGAVALMQPLLSAASEFWGATTLGDALGQDLDQLASTMGLGPAFDAISIRDLTGGLRISDEILSRIAALQASISAAERLILDQRLLSPSPQTLEQLGEQLGVTRERVRQIQHRLTNKIDSKIGSQLRVIAVLARQQLGPVIAARDLDERIAELFANRDDRHAEELAGRLLKDQLDYSCEKAICINGEAKCVVDDLRKAAHRLADDVGLIDETELQAKLPGEEWIQHWPTLFERCKLHRLTGRAALRDTAKARAKAALMRIGQPATREEIARLCGIDSSKIGSQLSGIPGVMRADKNRWGLTEWIDDEYEGVPAEIMQRIDEDGGATTLERLLDELPRMFGVSEGTVRVIVKTPQFVLQDGYVSVADESSIVLRDLNDVIDGRDASGAPYWTFIVEDRYFDGYSILNFPPELARELGCGPNGNTRARVVQPPDCEQLSVNWRLSSPNGASLGHLADPLRRLVVSAKDRVRVVIKAPNLVELYRDIAAEPSDSRADATADLLLERMKNRRKVL